MEVARGWRRENEELLFNRYSILGQKELPS
jgi:hypothetical protein